MSKELVTKENVIREGNKGYINVGTGVYTFEVMGVERFASSGILPFYTSNRRLMPYRIGEFLIVPNGEYNHLPEELREVLDNNNLTPGVLEKAGGLIWGQGPALYEERFEGGIRQRFYNNDAQIESWLGDWNYEEYLQKALGEFAVMKGHFTKYVRNKAPRIGGKPMINKLEHVSSVYARLGWHNPLDIVTEIIIGDFILPWVNGLTKLPVFNKKDPFAYPIAMNYSNMYQFALDNDYGRPSFYGNINWMKLGNSIPLILNAFNLNTAALHVHIESPGAYWEKEEQKLRDRCLTNNTEYTDKMLDDLKDEKLAAFANSITGVDKVGKLMHTESVEDNKGEYIGWKVTVLDKKTKEYIEGLLEEAKTIAMQTNAGLGIHPALTGLSFEGNLPSGSEQLYAFKFYLLTSTDLQESIICRDINNAIRANFPGTKMKLGFYHDEIKTESQVSPDKRIISQPVQK
ncbi:MAG: hypothetical protein NTZ33_14470 [Bacteroidetes bacterium]|nr:hypothetical protein [Bacteroidota bacterium]